MSEILSTGRNFVVVFLLSPDCKKFGSGRYPGNSDTFDKAIVTFSVAYADQNERDFEFLKKGGSKKANWKSRWNGDSPVRVRRIKAARPGTMIAEGVC